MATKTRANPEVIELFAAFHDSCRLNDGTDPEHGARGAELAASVRGTLFELPDAAFDQLHFACTWHTDQHFHDDPTIATCWDADRLDLGRVGIRTSPDFLNADYAKELCTQPGLDYVLSQLGADLERDQS